jgi:SAM-dependent methyltransferase
MKLLALSIMAAVFVPAIPSSVADGQIPTPPPTNRRPDVIYVPTPSVIVDVMLKMARVTEKDVVYDLGCGDGRIVIEAAKLYGARGVGVDIDPRRILMSRANARKAGVDDRVDFLMEDIFESDIREASVVTLYLLPTLNMQIRQKLWNDLAVGTRVVSHAYDMGDWVPDQVEVVTGRSVYLWTITEETKKAARIRGVRREKLKNCEKLRLNFSPTLNFSHLTSCHQYFGTIIMEAPFSLSVRLN